MRKDAPKGNPPFFPAEGEGKPGKRTVGLTHVLDRFADRPDDEWLGMVAPYTDIVKIGWGLPLLFPREVVRRRVAQYHRHGIEVSTGGTLLEYAVSREQERQAIREAKDLGFDMVEVSEGVLDLTLEQVERLSAEVRSADLGVLIEVGKKDPQRQYSLRETMDRLNHARRQGPRKVILESRESGKGVGIYDQAGNIKWEWVHAIVAGFPMEDIIFEAPREEQQIGLIVEMGPEVNLGNVAPGSIVPLATQRRGMRGDTFGLPVRHAVPRGPPALKFVYYLIGSHRGLDQGELVALSRLPRRTVQAATKELESQGLIRESVSFRDARRREYRCV